MNINQSDRQEVGRPTAGGPGEVSAVEEWRPRSSTKRETTATRWIRGDASIEGEWITLNKETVESYVLHEHSDLVFDLAALPRPLRPADALAFAREHGLLWHNGDTFDLKEKFTDWEEHAKRLNQLLDRYASKPWLRHGFSKAPQGLMMAVSKGLKGVRLRLVLRPAAPSLESDPKDVRFAVDVATEDLLGMAYYQLAQLIQSEQPIRQCEECRRYFALRDQRMRFCSARCSSTASSRRYSQRKRAQEGLDGIIRPIEENEAV